MEVAEKEHLAYQVATVSSRQTFVTSHLFNGEPGLEGNDRSHTVQSYQVN